MTGGFLFARFGRVRWRRTGRYTRRTRPTPRLNRWRGRGPSR